jgi:uncharacterized membrane protein
MVIMMNPTLHLKLNFKRIAKHWSTTRWQLQRAFPPASLERIAQAINASESTHAGEIRFVAEGALDGWPLVRGQSAKERAIDVFSQLRVWDTQHNNGLLIYLLLADRAVELVADRGIHAKVSAGEWDAICRSMEAAFRQGQYEGGALGGIQAVTEKLAQHFPAAGNSGNELPDQPVLL